MTLKATDWDSYYQRPYKTATLTRRHTASVLTQLIKTHGGVGARILELGGANSCFIDHILSEVHPSRYDVIDLNKTGIDKLLDRYPNDPRVNAAIGDVLNPTPAELYDIVYSVGLIEHFDVPTTARAVAGHFDYLRAGGTAIITFPTPTLLYRSVRALSELTSQWIFHDERPIRLPEFEVAAAPYGDIVSAKILWPLMLTQYCCAIRKR